jgi:hypothetical protein
MIKVDKPLLVVQSTGGANPAARSWTRNPPPDEFDQFLLRYMETHYIVHICLPDTPALTNVHQRVDTLNRRQAMCLIYFAQEVVGIDSYALHARHANLKAGISTFFFPLAESVDRLGYPKSSSRNIVPVQKVQDMIKNHTDYYATIFKLSIENVSDNCPVPVGTKWFLI